MAWRSLGNMSRVEAKQRYLALLTSVLPSWKDWYAEHGHRHKEQMVREEEHGKVEKAGAGEVRGEGEAYRLLKAFKDRTGFTIPSRL